MAIHRLALQVIMAMTLVLAIANPLQAQTPQRARIIDAVEIARTAYAARAAALNEPTWEFSSYISNIDNYSIGISENKDYYVIVFLLRKKGAPLTGGGGEYWVRKNDLGIAKFIGYE